MCMQKNSFFLNRISFELLEVLEDDPARKVGIASISRLIYVTVINLQPQKDMLSSARTAVSSARFH